MASPRVFAFTAGAPGGTAWDGILAFVGCRLEPRPLLETASCAHAGGRRAY